MDEIKNKFWAVGGGKGGVGKTMVTLLLGASLARLGRKVILVDADLGGSNLHTFTGLRAPEYTLVDFISRKVDTIDEVVMDTPVENLRLICGADDIPGIANLKYAQKTRIFTHLKELEADIVLLDLGAGSSFTTLDFFLYAPNKIVVLTPQVTSIQNAYGFIKASLYRSLHKAFSKEKEALELIRRTSYSVEGEAIDSVARLFEALSLRGKGYQKTLMDCLNSLNIKLLVNMVTYPNEKDVSDIVKSVAKNYLSLEIENLGTIQYDDLLHDSVDHMAGILTNRKGGLASGHCNDIAHRILKNSNIQFHGANDRWPPPKIGGEKVVQQMTTIFRGRGFQNPILGESSADSF
jgi:flagellar biosynthesis protein FlhG